MASTRSKLFIPLTIIGVVCIVCAALYLRQSKEISRVDVEPSISEAAPKPMALNSTNNSMVSVTPDGSLIVGPIPTGSPEQQALTANVLALRGIIQKSKLKHQSWRCEDERLSRIDSGDRILFCFSEDLAKANTSRETIEAAISDAGEFKKFADKYGHPFYMVRLGKEGATGDAIAFTDTIALQNGTSRGVMWE